MPNRGLTALYRFLAQEQTRTLVGYTRMTHLLPTKYLHNGAVANQRIRSTNILCRCAQ
jgi:hypothetical protein